jgi:hypothetical protein
MRKKSKKKKRSWKQSQDRAAIAKRLGQQGKKWTKHAKKERT